MTVIETEKDMVAQVRVESISIDTSEAKKLGEILQELVEKGNRYIFMDLFDLRYGCSDFISNLLYINEELKEQQGELIIVSVNMVFYEYLRIKGMCEKLSKSSNSSISRDR